MNGDSGAGERAPARREHPDVVEAGAHLPAVRAGSVPAVVSPPGAVLVWPRPAQLVVAAAALGVAAAVTTLAGRLAVDAARRMLGSPAPAGQVAVLVTARVVHHVYALPVPVAAVVAAGPPPMQS